MNLDPLQVQSRETNVLSFKYLCNKLFSNRDFKCRTGWQNFWNINWPQISPCKSGNMEFRRNSDLAIPLCLPNNCHWNPATGEYSKTGGGRTSLYVVDEALQKLRTVRGKLPKTLFVACSNQQICWSQIHHLLSAFQVSCICRTKSRKIQRMSSEGTVV